MALVSPGVQVTVVDESNYIPAATNSVPYILLATAQNKISASGVGVAAGTLKVNANKIYLISSQRDLAATFGNPFFYKTTAGTPINGYELNEYGLLAAYSALGVTNRAYIQRADINLADLTASLTRPLGEPTNDTYWLDTANTVWGIFQWNSVTGQFTNQVPTVITSTTDLTSGVPSINVGSIGGYAVVATNTANPIYYKNGSVTVAQTSATALSDLYNTWVLVGSDAWKLSWPTVQGTNSVTTTLTAGNTIVINGTSVNVPVSTNNTLAGLSAAINNAAIQGVYSAVVNNKIQFYIDSSATADGSTAGDGIIVFGNGSTPGLMTTLGLTTETTYYAPTLQQSPTFTVPRWRTSDDMPHPTGSVWNKVNNVNLGTNMVVKKYSTTLGSWIQQAAPAYANDWSANAGIDPSSGGRLIAAGSTYTQYNVSPEYNAIADTYNNTYTLKVFERVYYGTVGQTVITGNNTAPVFVNGTQFSIQTSVAGSTTLTNAVTVTINGTTAADFVAAVSSASVANVSASVDSSGAIVFTQRIGGVIVLDDVSGTPVAAAGFTNTVNGCRTSTDGSSLILSSWVALTYTASSSAPTTDPADGRYWYYSATNQVDIMINTGSSWKGYQNVTNDVRGYNLQQTSPNGPIISATQPTTQSDNTPLVYGDLWIDTSNLELYPVIYRWSNANNIDTWALVNNTDQTTENGVLFADARWDTNGTTNPITGAIPTIKSLLTSDYTDVDAPDPALYPTGMLLWNTRRSGFNVKTYQSDYFSGSNFPYNPWSNTTSYGTGNKVNYNAVIYVCIANAPSGTLPTNTSFWAPLMLNTWVTAAGNRSDGSPYMGRFAQRALIVAALSAGINASTAIREEQNEFNLMACPQYPELLPNMIALNNERGNTAFVVGDTPLRLPANATDIVAWATNNNGEGVSTADGISNDLRTGGALNAASVYSAVFWPSCQTTDNTGSLVVQPPSHMMIRTIIRNDQVGYPWLAPAGTQRGVVDNASAIGYIDAATGEFITTGVNQGLRDVLYTNSINPITFVPGIGITNFGNKTLTTNSTALNRINVSRLLGFIRARLMSIGKQFLFEPNDQITRNEIRNTIVSLMIDLVAKRGIYDYLVVCDLSNNTPARIDANELWVDIAIEPIKAVEFIYIPIRIKNTGEIAAGQTANATAL
jgi:hypothetical protein